jgi:hypothetical protein
MSLLATVEHPQPNRRVIDVYSMLMYVHTGEPKVKLVWNKPWREEQVLLCFTAVLLTCASAGGQAD